MTAAKPRSARKPAAKPKTPAVRGRPRIPFTGTDVDKVRLLARAGTKRVIIAEMMGVSVDTLERRFPDELAEGKEHANALVSATLFEKALSGDTASIIWWDKTRGGHRDTSRHEHTGADGAPIELKNMTHMTEDQLDLLERATLLLAGPSVSGTGEQSEADPR